MESSTIKGLATRLCFWTRRHRPRGSVAASCDILFYGRQVNIIMSTFGGPMRITDLNDLPPQNDRTMFSLSTSERAQVPTKINPIRFAILYRDGRTSNAWGVKVQNTGDGYIYCRDNMKGQKVSLYASGKQHISIDPKSPSAVNLTENQFMNQWHEPDERNCYVQVSFSVLGNSAKRRFSVSSPSRLGQKTTSSSKDIMNISP